jgi:glutathione S-transferase
MAKMTLTYFDMSISRGEECRLALFVAGQEFVDERIPFADWEKRKPLTPYGGLPVLTVEGHPPVAQSNAILRLVGSLHGLHPTDPWEAARHEALMGAIEDLRVRVGATKLKDDAERLRARDEVAKGFMQEWGAHVEAQLGDPFVGGATLQVADLKLHVAMGSFLSGRLDGIPVDVFKAFPKLTRHTAAVKDHPRVRAWTER